VIRAAGSGAAGNIDLHRDGAVAAAGAGDGKAGVADILGDAVGGRTKLQLAGTGRHVVVGDGQHGRSRSNQRRAAGHVLKGQVDGLVAFDQIVVEDGDAQVLAGDARPEGERVVGGRGVIGAAGSGAAGNIDLHRDGAVA